MAQGDGGAEAPPKAVELSAKLGEVVPLKTGVPHTLRLGVAKPRVRAVLRDESGEVAAGCRYELQVGEESFSGTTADDGLVDHPYAPGPDKAELRIWFKLPDGAEEEHILDLLLELPSLHSIEGVQARLNNLGFDCGPIDGALGDRTRAAIASFQAAMGYEDAQGDLDEETRQALEALSTEGAE